MYYNKYPFKINIWNFKKVTEKREMKMKILLRFNASSGRKRFPVTLDYSGRGFLFRIQQKKLRKGQNWKRRFRRNFVSDLLKGDKCFSNPVQNNSK